ncbi:transposase, IS605 OrfB family, central region [Leptolyngbyaceae cyanobacterium JSC-12]|nr:transposase, IS605 OrfB family, central region [Leptolyngbyaceae cyanobacterium JSC-12]
MSIVKSLGVGALYGKSAIGNFFTSTFYVDYVLTFNPVIAVYLILSSECKLNPSHASFQGCLRRALFPIQSALPALPTLPTLTYAVHSSLLSSSSALINASAVSNVGMLRSISVGLRCLNITCSLKYKLAVHSPKSRFIKIGVAADLLGVSIETLRKWEQTGELVPDRKSLPKQYGCLGVDINPGVIGWTYVDRDGNLKHHGQFKINLHSRRSGQIAATLHDVTKQLVTLAQTFRCPIVIENLDFQSKKSQMREQGRRYARMLSGFIYGKFTTLLEQKCELAGIELIKVNPAYSSTIGLVKFMRQYGLSLDTAAAMVLARRAMRLSERVPNRNAYADVKSAKHVWSAWYTLHNKLKPIRRHQYFTLANSQLEAMLCAEPSGRVQSKRKSTSKRGANPRCSNRTATIAKA